MERSQMRERLYEIYRQPLKIQADYTLNKCERYAISMKSDYLNAKGDTIKGQELSAIYSRTIKAVLSPIIALTTFQWESATFRKRKQKGPWSAPLPWTFVQGLTFDHYFIYTGNKTERQILEDESFSSLQEIIQRNVNLSYTGLPKLPAAYLVVLQTLDILGFEVLSSYIHSAPELLHSIGEPVYMEFLSNMESPIGFGLYSDSSLFKNGDFYLTYLGYGLCSDRICSMFEFECEGSQVQMRDDKINSGREGTSSYHGTVHIDFETGAVVRGKMLESFVAVQRSTTNLGKQAAPVHVRRHVQMDLIQEETGHE